MNSLIPENVINAIWEQIVVEKYNANFYLYIAGYLKNKGLDKLASKFEEQHDEETSHAKKLFDLLTDLNAPVVMLDIPKVDIVINNITDIGRLYLEREVKTTADLTELKLLAIEEGCSIEEELFREMIKMQQKEIEEATTFLDQAEIIGDDWKFALLWDRSL